MFTGTHNAIIKHLLRHNPFVAQGFAHAWQDGETGMIWADAPKGRRVIFPADNLGDYIYLRTLQAGSLRDDFQKFAQHIGCKRGGMVATSQVRLVAVINGADADALTHRVLNVLAMYDTSAVLPTAMQWNRELVVASEMDEAQEQEVEAALRRLKKEAIISIDFTLTASVRFTKLEQVCLPEICPTC